MNTELIKKFTTMGVIEKGDFVLRSGAHSPYYCNIKKSYGRPEMLKEIATNLLPLIPKEATCIASSGYGGIPLGVALSLASMLPLVLVRDKVKEHGTMQEIDGYVPREADSAVIVDDVFTTGGSIADTLSKLSRTGCRVLRAVVVVRRGNAQIELPVFSLITEDDFSTI